MPAWAVHGMAAQEVVRRMAWAESVGKAFVRHNRFPCALRPNLLGLEALPASPTPKRSSPPSRGALHRQLLRFCIGCVVLF